MCVCGRGGGSFSPYKNTTPPSNSSSLYEVNKKQLTIRESPEKGSFGIAV